MSTRWMTALALAACVTAHAAMAESLALRTDPFHKPALEEIPLDVPAGLETEPAEAAALPELRGILRSPRATLVNLNGDLVPVGGRFERFVVVAVGERNVVLREGEEQHVISLDAAREKPVEPAYR